MSSDRHERAAGLFRVAAELPEGERRAWLEERCGDDPALLAEVLELLAYDVDSRGPIPESEAAASTESASTAAVRLLTEQRPRKPRYRLVGEVARGGMGAILKVWDKTLGRQLAMKIVLGHAEVSRTGATPPIPERTLARFLDEARITGQLDHPGIVPVHELGVDDHGRVFFTMRLVKGHTLQVAFDRLHEGAPDWSLARTLGALSKVCEAMAYAHEHGVVHRDLKPANVMVGRFGEVYVMDWGLGRVIGQPDQKDIRPVVPEGPISAVLARPDSGELATRDGDVLGTPSYMAPEQARGQLEAIGKRSDVYSVGAMLYHLLVGRPPYVRPGERSHALHVFHRLLDGPPESLERAAPGSPPELVAICERAMAREPAERYPDMRAMAEDLRAFLEDRVVRAHRTGAVVEFTKWVRRNRLTATGLAAAGVAVLGAGILYIWQEKRNNRTLSELYDGQLTVSLQRDIDELPPPHPSRIPALEALLERGQGLLARKRTDLVMAPSREDPIPTSVKDLPAGLQTDYAVFQGFAALLQEENALLSGAGLMEDERSRLASDVGVLTIEAPYREEVFRRRLQQYRIRAALEDGAEDSRLVHGLRLRLIEIGLERVRTELAWARELAEGAEGQGEAWRSCLASIANPRECPSYDGLNLEPILGLVPLRRDPDSGLWEFHHVLSGERPELGADDRWVIGPGTGIVLVLVPGDPAFVMGATRAAIDGEATSGALLKEGPPRTVQLGPYLLSKYELTQGQWVRLTGGMPSSYFAGSQFWDERRRASLPRFSRAHPVESVSCEDAARALARWALSLPTEAQWERAARAGGMAAFGHSDTPASLERQANVGDQALASFYPAVTSLLPWDDGYGLHAPVGSFEPNPFGLYDMQGNVSEWTRDWNCESLAEEDVERVVPGTGELVPPYSFKRTFRGSSFKSTGDWLRISYRSEASPGSFLDGTGVRPSLDLPSASADTEH